MIATDSLLRGYVCTLLQPSLIEQTTEVLPPSKVGPHYVGDLAIMNDLSTDLSDSGADFGTVETIEAISKLQSI